MFADGFPDLQELFMTFTVAMQICSGLCIKDKTGNVREKENSVDGKKLFEFYYSIFVNKYNNGPEYSGKLRIE